MKFKRRLKPNATIDLIPMIDVVFQLVVFFMVSSTFVEIPGIPITYPESSTAETVQLTKMIVTIADDNRIFLNRTLYSFNDFSAELERMSASDKQSITAVIIEGDETVSYSLMINVLDLLREQGFTGVNLRLKQEG